MPFLIFGKSYRFSFDLFSFTNLVFVYRLPIYKIVRDTMYTAVNFSKHPSQITSYMKVVEGLETKINQHS